MRIAHLRFIFISSLIFLVISCSGSGGNQNQDAPKVQTEKIPNADYSQITLNHALQSGELNWTLRILDEQNRTTGQKEDQCELQVLKVGSQASVNFKGDLRTPFCSGFEIDPVSTIDNISIISPNQKIEICLNNVCNEISLK